MSNMTSERTNNTVKTVESQGTSAMLAHILDILENSDLTDYADIQNYCNKGFVLVVHDNGEVLVIGNDTPA